MKVKFIIAGVLQQWLAQLLRTRVYSQHIFQQNMLCVDNALDMEKPA
jgi:hypothetical protein